MRGWGAVLVLVISSGCTSVKLVQRDGCWVRQTERLWHVKEDLGPCARPSSPWVEDRLTRLVQECVAREDYRWQSRALAAWNRGEPLPEQASESNVLQDCMNEAAGAMIGENESLKDRLASMKDHATELAKDRDTLRARMDDDRTHLLASHDKIADYLGEAAKKAQPPAVATATATSDGQARTENTATRSDTTSAPQPAPVTVVATTPTAAAPACAPAAAGQPLRHARFDRKGSAAPRPKAPACDPPATAAATPAPEAPAAPPAAPEPAAP